MTPPQQHWQVETLSRAGMPPIITVAAPGFHGVVTGTQGIGVKTPRAAAVADATVGLAMDMHMPKGGMFVMGTKSMMLAAGVFALLFLLGTTFIVRRAIPNPPL